jgi:hypothetical protein
VDDAGEGKRMGTEQSVVFGNNGPEAS